MAKLCQIIAVCNGKKSQAIADFTKLYHTLQKSALFDGISRTYKPRDVEGEQLPAEMKRVRSLVPEMPLLIPGIGAQGGDVMSAVRFGCDTRGEMAIINASRSVIYASNGRDFALAARTAALKLRNEINIYRDRFF